MSRRGVKGVNFHGVGTAAPYSAIHYPNSTSDTPAVRPMYYGLLAFSELISEQALWLDITIRHSGFPLIGSSSYVHAVTAQDRTTKVVVIAKETHPSSKNIPIDVAIHRQGPLRCPNFTTASLVRLTSSTGFTATSGISWAGQTFDGTANGNPIGKRRSEVVHVQSNGSEQQMSQ